MKSEKNIERLVEKIIDLKPILPGSITKQYKICGKKNCRCMDKENPQKHVCYQISYRYDKRARTLFVNPKDVEFVSSLNESYNELRSATLELGEESANLIKEYGPEKGSKIIEKVIDNVKNKILKIKTDKLKELEFAKSSLDNWKEKAVKQQDQLDKNKVKIRDLTQSRDKWKQEAMALRTEKSRNEKSVKLLNNKVKDLEKSLEEINQKKNHK